MRADEGDGDGGKGDGGGEGEGDGLRANQQGKTVVTHRRALALSAADTLLRNGAPGSRQSALRAHVSNLYLVFAFT